jgi:hypothetical protein
LVPMQTLYSMDKIDETAEGVKQEQISGSVESRDVIKDLNTNQLGVRKTWRLEGVPPPPPLLLSANNQYLKKLK